LLAVPTPYIAKPSLTSIFKTADQVQKESQMQKQRQIREVFQNQVIESIMGQIRVEDRARVGELILLWKGKVWESDRSTTLTHEKVNLPHCFIEHD
jgi:hypothetical protein